MKDSILIFGCSKQDGHYLYKVLDNYDVVAVPSHNHPNGIDVTSKRCVERIISDVSPKIIFNLASIPSTDNGDRNRIYNTIYNGNDNILNHIYEKRRKIKLVIASSAYMYESSEKIITLNSRLRTDNPYSLARLNSRNLAYYYHSLGVNVVCAHMFHHESYRRGENSLIIEIANQFKDIKKGVRKHLDIKNINTVKEWTHAYDMMIGLKLIAEEYTKPEIIVATGKSYSITDLVKEFSRQLNIDVPPIISQNNKNTKYVGDSSSMVNLSWKTTITFEELCNEVLKMTGLNCEANDS